MATTNFKNKVKEFFFCVCKNLWALLGAIFMTVLVVVGAITSPLWFPALIICNPEQAATEYYNKAEKGDFCPMWFEWYTVYGYNAVMWVMRLLWKPVISILPMKYRREFITECRKRLSDYPAKVQVAYYKTCCGESKENLIAHGGLSKEALDLIWEDKDERKYWKTYTNAQIKSLVEDGFNNLLKNYFKSYSPNKEKLDILLTMAGKGYMTAMYALKDIICRERPNPELVGKLLAIDNSEFVKSVQEIVDWYSDMDAVNYQIEDEAKTAERWLNFCMGKKEISDSAQKKMNYNQYLVFVETGHTLAYYALKHLCLNVHNEEYLKAIVRNEFARIDDTMQTALKSEYWRYSVYLAVKQEKKENNA
jgi:hypothetical protein